MDSIFRYPNRFQVESSLPLLSFNDIDFNEKNPKHFKCIVDTNQDHKKHRIRKNNHNAASTFHHPTNYNLTQIHKDVFRDGDNESLSYHNTLPRRNVTESLIRNQTNEYSNLKRTVSENVLYPRLKNVDINLRSSNSNHSRFHNITISNDIDMFFEPPRPGNSKSMGTYNEVDRRYMGVGYKSVAFNLNKKSYEVHVQHSREVNDNVIGETTITQNFGDNSCQSQDGVLLLNQANAENILKTIDSPRCSERSTFPVGQKIELGNSTNSIHLSEEERREWLLKSRFLADLNLDNLLPSSSESLNVNESIKSNVVKMGKVEKLGLHFISSNESNQNANDMSLFIQKEKSLENSVVPFVLESEKANKSRFSCKNCTNRNVKLTCLGCFRPLRATGKAVIVYCPVCRVANPARSHTADCSKINK